jgi:exodeoxyribonuclease V alpha subunit
VAAINRLAEQALHRAHLIAIPDGRGANWYAGRPVLVTANDYRLGLFNGDNGLTVAAADAEKRLSVCFPGADTAVRRFGPQELTAIETVFAMTVHKSQGSEFDRVHLILPDIDSPLLTRELIYTAVTRARSKVTIWGSRPMLTAAIARRIERRSGLRDALWGEGAGD